MNGNAQMAENRPRAPYPPPEPGRVPEIHRACSELHEAVSRLHGEIAELIMRLESVMGPQMPGRDDPAKQAQEGTSKIGVALFTAVRELNGLIEGVRTMRGRLET